MTDSVARTGGGRSANAWDSLGGSNDTERVAGAKNVCSAAEPLRTGGDSGGWTAGADWLVARSGSPSRPTPPTDNNAERSAAIPIQLIYADAGLTSSRDSAYAGVALLKGHAGGGNIEIVSASAQVGGQTELQVGVARASIALGDSANCELRTLEGDLHQGEHNPDGSSGTNVGGGYSWVAAECTVTESGSSLTFGASASVSAELSLGMRDSDADGEQEHCARVAAGPLVVGACLEFDTAVTAMRDFYQQLTSVTATGESR